MPTAPAPITSARRRFHACRPPIARACRIAGADRRRLGEDAQRPERRRDRDQLARILRHELPREAVQPCDPALAVVAGEARVRRARLAGRAVPAGAAHRRGDELAAREAVAVALDDGEELVTEHEAATLRRGPEMPVRDLAVGAADADLERPDDDVALGALVRDLRDARRPGPARLGDERERHLSAG